jgi:hypothetical protein
MYGSINKQLTTFQNCFGVLPGLWQVKVISFLISNVPARNMLSASYQQSVQGSGDWFSRWSSRLWRRSAATRLLGWRVRIPPGAWVSVSCDSCVLPGTGHCEGPTTRREESYRVCLCVCVCVCVIECDQVQQ